MSEKDEWQRLVEMKKIANYWMARCSRAEKQLEQREWISVKDRMPEKGGNVLAWFEYYRFGEYNCLYQTYGIGTYFEKTKSWMINGETGWRNLRVIAWMPLPQKPESEDDAE